MLLTHEPGDTPVGKDIRRIVLDPATGHLADRTEALLYAADKAEHVEKVVLPALERGEVVITDRYVDSTLAYQGAGRALDAAELELVAALGHRRPAAAPDRAARPRAQRRARPASRSATASRASRSSSTSACASEFLRLAEADPDHYLVLDARGRRRRDRRRRARPAGSAPRGAAR